VMPRLNGLTKDREEPSGNNFGFCYEPGHEEQTRIGVAATAAIDRLIRD
jgi:hypothetical protein